MEKKKRIINKIGNVYGIPLGDGKKCYMQFVYKDVPILNSDIVRVFTRIYDMDEKPSIEEIISDKVRFYTHVWLRLAVHQADIWKEGTSKELGLDELKKITFYSFGETVKWSKLVRRSIFKIGEEREYIYTPIPDSDDYADNCIWHISAIIDRINTGHWCFDPREKVEDKTYIAQIPTFSDDYKFPDME